ncbi:MAG: SAM-dependent methyltransferase, partial [Bacteroidaceae bacterium]|nr:SAM-dependent methyltransferase [Bacteroidaceae bacterium]
DVAGAVTQIEGWRTACHKLPTWAAQDAVVYPSRLAMEHCSSEATARYKAGLAGSMGSSSRLTDLTGGFGVDCTVMAAAFDEVTYVERNPALCAVTAANFAAFGLTHVHVVQDDARDVLQRLPMQDWIVVDPARRDTAGRKMVSLADCEPDVVEMESLLLAKAHHVLIKCSPMLDISLALRQLRSVQEVHVVAVQNECKELLLICGSSPVEPTIHAVNLRADGSIESNFAFTSEEEQACTPAYTNRVGRWLYEPNVALLKAGCFRLPTVRYGLMKLHPNSQLYTSDARCPDFPGRTFEVVGASGFGKQEVKTLLGDMRKANIAVRNFPESVDVLRKRLHLSEGGNDYLFASTLSDNRHTLIHCR